MSSSRLSERVGVDQMPGHGCGGRSGGAHKVGARTSPLASHEIAVGGARAAHARSENVVVHCQAQRAAALSWILLGYSYGGNTQ